VFLYAVAREVMFMPFELAPSENNMWAKPVRSLIPRPSDDEINSKYSSRELRIVTESNREQLPNFVEALKRHGWMKLRPSYQRRPRWDRERQSRLIESFITNIPVPPLFVYESDLAKYEIMNGQQRITAIFKFHTNRYPWEGIQQWPELNGRIYDTLPSGLAMYAWASATTRWPALRPGEKEGSNAGRHVKNVVNFCRDIDKSCEVSSRCARSKAKAEVRSSSLPLVQDVHRSLRDRCRYRCGKIPDVMAVEITSNSNQSGRWDHRTLAIPILNYLLSNNAYGTKLLHVIATLLGRQRVKCSPPSDIAKLSAFPLHHVFAPHLESSHLD
jgi:hypothetical protein